VVLPYESKNVHVSVTVPPPGPAGVCGPNVEVAEPLITQAPVAPEPVFE
jgi:hypothetical protein